MPNSLSDRIALVTGASFGIGAALSLQLAQAGAHVIAAARTDKALDELDGKIKAAGCKATMVPLDVTDSAAIDKLARTIKERHGKLDILVGNAGVLGQPTLLAQYAPKDWDNMIAVNVSANYHLLYAMDALLQAAPAGRAVFLTSAVAHMGRPQWGPYAASKAALEAFVRSYAAETATTNVRANLFGPGPTRTRMYLGAFPNVDPNTLPTPEQVAEQIVPLCSADCVETGRLYDARAKKFLEFRPPA